MDAADVATHAEALEQRLPFEVEAAQAEELKAQEAVDDDGQVEADAEAAAAEMIEDHLSPADTAAERS